MAPGRRILAIVIKPASRFDGIEISLIRQINALATPLTINLGIGEPNVVPDAELLDMARRATSMPWSYSANAGAIEVRRAIGTAVAPSYDPDSEICITAGTQEGLYAIMQAFVDAGDEVLVPDPGFLAYATIAKLAGGAARTYALDDAWQIDFETLERAVTPRTKLIIVNSPSNPTGAVLGADTLQRVVRLAEEKDILVVSDEVYREIYYEMPPASLRGASRNVIVVDGLSKSHAMTGLRLGWILAERGLMQTIVKAHQYIATCASVFSQQLAKLIFENSSWNEQWLENVRSQFAHQRATALAACEQRLHTPVVPSPAGAFYIFLPVPSCDTIGLARAIAVDASVLTIPGVAFGSRGEGHLRLSYATSEEQITGGIARLAGFLDAMEEARRR